MSYFAHGDALTLLDGRVREAGATDTVGELAAVTGDATQLEQTYMDLIPSARKPSGRRPRSQWRISESDSGEYVGRIVPRPADTDLFTSVERDLQYSE